MKTFKTIFALGVFGVLGFIIFTDYGGVRSSVYGKYFPCKTVISYTLGDFDKKFGISEKDFLAVVASAEAVWEKPLGREFFNYVPASEDNSITKPLEINLVYDYRQEATKRIQSLGLVINETRASYDALKDKYAILDQEYKDLRAKYEARVSAFKERQEAYSREVDSWNKKGGAPENVYQDLKAEEEALKKEFSAIQSLESNLNKQVDDINALVAVINDLAKTLNINARTLNTIGEARGEEFTEGEFKSVGFDREINIYEFSTKDKLLRVLAHEFGHALGLDHVEDPTAIMYYLNENKNGQLSEADLEAVKSYCKIK